MSVLDQAKKAKEQAAALASEAATRATELKSQASAKAADVRDASIAKATDIRDASIAKATDIRDASIAKATETIDAFNSALPVIREAGYEVDEVAIELGVPPKVSASFKMLREVSEEKIQELLATNAERKLTILLVRTLHESWKLHNRIHLVGLRPAGMTVELGLIPSVTIKFGK